MRKTFAAVIFLFLVQSANAFTISTLVNEGCHEKIASRALRSVRDHLSTAKKLPLTNDEEAMVDDVQFKTDPDMRDLGGITFLLAIRDNDLKGHDANDLTELATIHGNPEFQDEHCLRSINDDEPDGSTKALDRCRAFITKRVSQAIDGLDSQSFPDLNNRTSLQVHLALRGDVNIPLPTYYVRIGQAIHTIQDSFTHTYRTPDGMKITVIENWVEFVDEGLVESRDGPPHAQALDVCNDPDEFRKNRRELATNASAAILKTTLNPQLNKNEKMTDVENILDTYLGYSPGCTYANQWCDAKETQYKDPESIVPGCNSNGGSLMLIVFVMLFYFGVRRKNMSTAYLLIAVFGFGISLMEIPNTFAEDASLEQAEPAPPAIPKPDPGPVNASKGAWGAWGALSGSYDHPAFAGTVGVRRKFNKHWTFGWDAEWNPWVALNGQSPVRVGVFNTYGTVILRFPLAYENFNLRTTANIGTSTMLMDLYGVGRGTTGLYGGFSPLGIEWKAFRNYYVVLNPLNYAIAIPQLKGVPLTYSQYRVTLGLEWLAK